MFTSMIVDYAVTDPKTGETKTGGMSWGDGRSLWAPVFRHAVLSDSFCSRSDHQRLQVRRFWRFLLLSRYPFLLGMRRPEHRGTTIWPLWMFWAWIGVWAWRRFMDRVVYDGILFEAERRGILEPDEAIDWTWRDFKTFTIQRRRWADRLRWRTEAFHYYVRQFEYDVQWKKEVRELFDLLTGGRFRND